MCQRNAPCKRFDLFSTLLMPCRLPIGRLTCLAIETKSNRIEMKMKSKQNLFISANSTISSSFQTSSQQSSNISPSSIDRLNEFESCVHASQSPFMSMEKPYICGSIVIISGRLRGEKKWVMEININAHCVTCRVFYQKSQSRHQFVSADTSIESSRPRLVTTTTTAAAMKTSV